jgi:hypothetical protein
VLTACGGSVQEVFGARLVDVTTLATPLALAADPSFADERGGGLFIDLAGRVVRLHADGLQGSLEAHPGNPVAPGPATALWPLGPSLALAATSRGLFVADSGWLIAPPWRAALDAQGLVGPAVTGDAVGWLAHARGLFRLEGGQLGELTVDGASVTGLTAIAAGPTADGRDGLWFARGPLLTQATRASATGFVVRDSGLDPADLEGGVRGLAAIAPSPASAGELLAITPALLLQFRGGAWRRFALEHAPRRLLSAGRFAWLQAGDDLFRYDADAAEWLEAKDLAAAPELLAVDAAGGAWVRAGEQTLLVTLDASPRVQGLFQGATVYDAQLLVAASVARTGRPDALAWRLDDGVETSIPGEAGVAGAGAQAALALYPLGGVNALGAARPISLAALADGWHTLQVKASFGDVTATRRVHFEFRGAAAASIGWERDISPIAAARCLKCHGAGAEPELVTYQQWREHAAKVAELVAAQRMPADGPLDRGSMEAISRWVTGGLKP